MKNRNVNEQIGLEEKMDLGISAARQVGKDVDEQKNKKANKQKEERKSNKLKM